MIAYLYPPLGGTGRLRTLKFAKYLPKFGWKPFVLTPKRGVWPSKCDESEGVINNVEVIRTGYFDIISTIRKLAGFNPDPSITILEQAKIISSSNFFRRRFIHFMCKLVDELTFPDRHIGWYPYAISDGIKTIHEKEIDIIYSTSSPQTNHLIAHNLKQKTGLPWIADFRDLWSENHHIQHSYLRRLLDKKLEIGTIKDADVLLTVSLPLAEQLSLLHSHLKNKVYVITNSFDPDDFDLSNMEVSDKFTITYTGTFRHETNNPEPLFKAISLLAMEDKIKLDDFRIRFCGNYGSEFCSLAEKHGLKNVVTNCGWVPHAESVRQQCQSTLLLLLIENTTKERGVLTAKVFEYLGARRPILMVGYTKGALADLLEDTKAGVAVDPSDISKLKRELLNWYNEYKENGYIKYRGISDKISKYNSINTTKNLANLLDQLINV